MATRRYIRRCRLRVFHQGQRLVTIEDSMRLTFEVRRDSNKATQSSNVAVYNLARATASVIHLQGDSVELEAGYEGQPLGLIYSGEIRRVEHDRSSTERITTIGLGGADKARTMSLFSRSYSGPITVRAVAQDIAKAMGLPVDANSLTVVPDETLDTWVSSGLAEDALTELLDPRGVNWYTVDGQLRFAKADSPAIQSIFLLNEQSGMIGTPSETDLGMRAKMVLNPQVELDQQVRVRSQNLNGQFVITSVAHKGDTWEGEWATEIQCASIDRPTASASPF